MPNVDAYIDRLTETFGRDVDEAVRRAIDRTVARVADAVISGTGSETARNARALRGLARILRQELANAGLADVVANFGDSFVGQLPFFDEVVESLMVNTQAGYKMSWKDADLDYFKAKAITLESSIDLALDTVASTAVRRVMFSAGNLSIQSLTQTLAAGAKMPVSQALGVAETSQAVFFRTITARGANAIEAETGLNIGYVYDGASDSLTRPKCAEWLAATRVKPFTREEIRQLDNGQLPDVFVTCGGWRCRHQWRMVLIK